MPPPVLDKVMRLAARHHAAGRLREAAAIYRRILQREPDNAEALHALGVMAFQTGRAEPAEKLLLRSIEADPSRGSAHDDLATLRLHTGRTEDALAGYRHAIEIDPAYPLAHAHLGAALARFGEYEQAVEAYQRAVDVGLNSRKRRPVGIAVGSMTSVLPTPAVAAMDVEVAGVEAPGVEAAGVEAAANVVVSAAGLTFTADASHHPAALATALHPPPETYDVASSGAAEGTLRPTPTDDDDLGDGLVFPDDFDDAGLAAHAEGVEADGPSHPTAADDLEDDELMVGLLLADPSPRVETPARGSGTPAGAFASVTIEAPADPSVEASAATPVAWGRHELPADDVPAWGGFDPDSTAPFAPGSTPASTSPDGFPNGGFPNGAGLPPRFGPTEMLPVPSPESPWVPQIDFAGGPAVGESAVALAWPGGDEDGPAVATMTLPAEDVVRLPEDFFSAGLAAVEAVAIAPVVVPEVGEGRMDARPGRPARPAAPPRPAATLIAPSSTASVRARGDAAASAARKAAEALRVGPSVTAEKPAAARTATPVETKMPVPVAEAEPTVNPAATPDATAVDSAPAGIARPARPASRPAPVPPTPPAEPEDALVKTRRLAKELRRAKRAAPAAAQQAAELQKEGASHLRQRRLDEAIGSLQQLVALHPTSAKAHRDLGAAYLRADRLDEAHASLVKAIELRPRFADAFASLGDVFHFQAKIEEAIACYRKAIQLKPSANRVHSNLLLTLHYQRKLDAAALRDEHFKWAEQHARPLAGEIAPHDNEPIPDRPLRVGYVSADFRRHSVNYFLAPLLANRNRSGFHVTCYSDVHRPDDETNRIADLVDVWRDIRGESDEDVAKLVREDGIDILVDLAGHTGSNRLLAFARRPAPVQATYLGYPNTTGMTTIDYRVTDPLADPPGQVEEMYAERLARVSNFLCYEPPPDAPPVSAPPAVKNGFVTFGCFNVLAKVTPEAMSLWAKIMLVLPNSRLVMKDRHGTLTSPARRRVVQDIFAYHRISADRLDLLDKEPNFSAHLRSHEKVDVMLDPFPYNGATTTCESLWMGVPVVTLAGSRHAGRVGVSILTAAGLPDLIGQNAEGYARAAVVLARDVPRLTQMRQTLRQKLSASLLLDGKKAAATLERAYRAMWQRWCKTRESEGMSLSE